MNDMIHWLWVLKQWIWWWLIYVSKKQCDSFWYETGSNPWCPIDYNATIYSRGGDWNGFVVGTLRQLQTQDRFNAERKVWLFISDHRSRSQTKSWSGQINIAQNHNPPHWKLFLNMMLLLILRHATHDINMEVFVQRWQIFYRNVGAQNIEKACNLKN